jgi:hypothetical protein
MIDETMNTATDASTMGSSNDRNGVILGLAFWFGDGGQAPCRRVPVMFSQSATTRQDAAPAAHARQRASL